MKRKKAKTKTQAKTSERVKTNTKAKRSSDPQLRDFELDPKHLYS